MRNSLDQRILSRPVPVRWAGWTTTTTDLQNSGWSIAIEFDYRDSTYRLALHHKGLKLTAITDQTEISPAFATLDHYYRYEGDRDNTPVFTVRHVAPRILIATDGSAQLPRWVPIDATPRLHCMKLESLADLCVFAKRDDSKEVLIGQADMSVVEQLEAILKAQEPKQHEIRKRMLSTPATIRKIATLAEVA